MEKPFAGGRERGAPLSTPARKNRAPGAPACAEPTAVTSALGASTAPAARASGRRQRRFWAPASESAWGWGPACLIKVGLFADGSPPTALYISRIRSLLESRIACRFGRWVTGCWGHHGWGEKPLIGCRRNTGCCDRRRQKPWHRWTRRYLPITPHVARSAAANV